MYIHCLFLFQSIVGAASKLHNARIVTDDSQKTKTLGAAETTKLHSLQKTRERAVLHNPSVSKRSLKKRVWVESPSSEHGQAKEAVVDSTVKKLSDSDLAYLKQLAFTSYKYTANSKEKNNSTEIVNLSRPYQFSFFSKYE